MMKKLYLLRSHAVACTTACFLFILSMSSSITAQTTLPLGGLAFLEISTDNPDRFSFILLMDIENGTNIRFTDAGWSDTLNALCPNENGLVTWTATSSLPAGTVVEVIGNNVKSVSTGSVTFAMFNGATSGKFGLLTSGDQIIAYQSANNLKPTLGDFSPIAAITSASTKWKGVHNGSGILNPRTSDLPPGLTNTVNAVACGAGSGAQDEYDNAMFDPSLCSTISGSAASALLQLTDNSNWIGKNSQYATSFASTAGCATFSINPAFPVEWLSFDGSLTDAGVLLSWETASEYNSHYYEVQKSTNGFFFAPVDQVPAAGISSSTLSYEFLDVEFPSFRTYYRIKQVDMDGKVDYSPTIEIEKPMHHSVQLFPNPVSEVLSLEANSRIESVQVLNMQGQPMPVSGTPLDQGQQLRIDCKTLPAGLYMIRVRSVESESVLRFRKIN